MSPVCLVPFALFLVVPVVQLHSSSLCSVIRTIANFDAATLFAGFVDINNGRGKRKGRERESERERQRRLLTIKS